MAELIAYLPPLDATGEPLTLAEAKLHARVDADLTLDDPLIEGILIPGARQLAETQTGSAIRPARYRQRLRSFPAKGGDIAVTHGLVMAIDSITYADASGVQQTLPTTAYAVAVIDRETLISPTSGNWPGTTPGLKNIEITYTAGITPANLAAQFPSVRHWLLFAVAWGIAQKELFMISHGRQGFTELPTDYIAGLLDPITIRTRF